jgi:hypothetical protein
MQVVARYLIDSVTYDSIEPFCVKKHPRPIDRYLDCREITDHQFEALGNHTRCAYVLFRLLESKIHLSSTRRDEDSFSSSRIGHQHSHLVLYPNVRYFETVGKTPYFKVTPLKFVQSCSEMFRFVSNRLMLFRSVSGCSSCYPSPLFFEPILI